MRELSSKLDNLEWLSYTTLQGKPALPLSPPYPLHFRVTFKVWHLKCLYVVIGEEILFVIFHILSH